MYLCRRDVFRCISTCCQKKIHGIFQKGTKKLAGCSGGPYNTWYSNYKTDCKLRTGSYSVTCCDKRSKQGWAGGHIKIDGKKYCDDFVFFAKRTCQTKRFTLVIPTPRPTPKPTPKPPPSLCFSQSRSGWKKKFGNGYGGVDAVWGKKWKQHSGYYQIDWPIVVLSGSNRDGTWSLHAGCGNWNGQDGCNAICRSLSGTSIKSGWRVPCGYGYPSAANSIASNCLYKSGPVDSRTNDWSGNYGRTHQCGNPMNHCQCQGYMPRKCGANQKKCGQNLYGYQKMYSHYSQYGGVYAVYARRVIQRQGYYQLQWPIVELRGTNKPYGHRFALHSGCGNWNGQDGCHAICKSLTNSNLRSGWKTPCGSGYPAGAENVASVCIYKNGPVDSRKNDYSGTYGSTRHCGNPMNHCECTGRAPNC